MNKGVFKTAIYTDFIVNFQNFDRMVLNNTYLIIKFKYANNRYFLS